jgi:hypothetical protein
MSSIKGFDAWRPRMLHLWVRGLWGAVISRYSRYQIENVIPVTLPTLMTLFNDGSFSRTEAKSLSCA